MKLFQLKIVLIFAFYILLFAFIHPPVYSLMRSQDYQIDMGNLNFASGFSSGSNQRVGLTGGELGVGPYSTTGFKLWAGFWYIKSIIPFSFSLSNSVIDFGSLVANTPKTDLTTLTISFGGAGGYQVTVAENRPLTSNPSAITIRDTLGDNGTASESIADTWSQNTTYGFGYTMYGNDVPAPFPTAGPAGSNYKQFANLANTETPQAVMGSTQVGRNRTATLVYKVNINSTQAAGNYQNTITYIATPTF